MKKIILGGLVIVLIVMTGWTLRSRNQKQDLVENEEIISDGSKWVISDVLGLRVSIPDNWNVQREGEDKRMMIDLIAGDNSVVRLLLSQMDGESLNEHMERYDEIAATAYEGQASIEVLEELDKSNDLYEIVWRKERWLAADFVTEVFYIDFEGQVLKVEFLPGDGEENIALNEMETIVNSLESWSGE